jgi:hypothetical protein
VHQYFAVASLVTSDDQSAMPQGTLTGPKLATSVYVPEDNQYAREDVMGYLSFPYLSMQSYGEYKLRVTLMKVDDARESCEQGAVALQAVDSGSIQVTSGQQYGYY